jgi:hypothetical protein
LSKITKDELSKVPDGQNKYARAKDFYNNYDYLDAKKLSSELLAEISHAK